MKTTIAILILSAAAVLTACTASKTTTTEVVVFRDITEPHLLQPKADDIIRLYGFEKDQWNGGVFHFTDITHISFNPEEEAKLEPASKWLSNEFQRQDEVKNFQKEITDILITAGQVSAGKGNSSVYFPITNALNHLSESIAEHKYMFIYSDLMENEPSLSFYKSDKMKTLKENPDSLKKVFENELQLEMLNGITVYLLYEPDNVIKDEEYRIVSKFYKELFESKGARVEITPNINTN